MSLTVERCALSKALGTHAIKSALHWTIGTGEVNAKKTGSTLIMPAMWEIKKRIVLEAMLGIIKSLDAWGSVQLAGWLM